MRCGLCSEPITADEQRAVMYGDWCHLECARNEQQTLRRLAGQDDGQLTLD